MGNAEAVTIAIVDDHAMLRQTVKLRLSLLGYNVVLEAEHGKDLLNKLAGIDPEPGICLLDINMPEMDGFATAVELKIHWPNIRVIFFTMHNSKAYLWKANQIGVYGFLSKDASTEELIQTLNDAIKK